MGAREEWLRSTLIEAATKAGAVHVRTSSQRNAYVIGYLIGAAEATPAERALLDQLLGCAPEPRGTATGFRGEISQAVDP